MKIFIFLIFPLILLAQDNYEFGQSIIVNDDPPGTSFHSTSSAGQHLIGCVGDTVYLVWSDERIDPRAVYFSRSTDAGNTWSADLRLSSSSPDLDGATPSLTLDAHGNIYICYAQYDWSTFNVDVYSTRSTDGGLSFTTPVLVNDTTRAAQDYPSIAVDSSGEKVFVAWRDARNPVSPPNFDIYMAKSIDGGLSFLPSVRVDDTEAADTSDQNSPSIGCTRLGDTVYVVWQDERNRDGTDYYDIYFSRSVDGCISFEPDILVNDTVGTNQGTQRNPSLWAGNSRNIYIAWEDNRQYGYQIYFDKSLDGGISFGQDVKVSDDTIGGKVTCSVMADDSSRIYLVWRDYRTFSQTGHDIYFSFSSDAGSTFSANVMVNDTLGWIGAWDWYPTICVNETGKVYVAWESDRNDPSHANSDIYCATGNYVGIKEFVSQNLNAPIISVFPDPFKYHLTIQVKGRKIEKIAIFDVSGRRLKYFSEESSDLVSLNVADLPYGVYFVRVVAGSNTIVKKVIKVK